MWRKWTQMRHLWKSSHQLESASFAQKIESLQSFFNSCALSRCAIPPCANRMLVSVGPGQTDGATSMRSSTMGRPVRWRGGAASDSIRSGPSLIFILLSEYASLWLAGMPWKGSIHHSSVHPLAWAPIGCPSSGRRFPVGRASRNVS